MPGMEKEPSVTTRQNTTTTYQSIPKPDSTRAERAKLSAPKDPPPRVYSYSLLRAGACIASSPDSSHASGSEKRQQKQRAQVLRVRCPESAATTHAARV